MSLASGMMAAEASPPTASANGLSPSAAPKAPNAASKAKLNAAAPAPGKPAPVVLEETILMGMRAGRRLSLVRSDAQGDCKGYLGGVEQGWIAYPDPKIPGDDYQAVCSPDGRSVALLSTRSGALNAWLLSEDARHWQALTDDDGGIMDPALATGQVLAFSPNGKELALLRRGTIWVTGIETPQPLAIGSAPGVRALAWSPDSRWIAYVAGKSLRKIEATGVSDQLLVADRVDEASIAWNPDAKLETLYFMSQGLCRVDADRRVDLLVPSASHPNNLALLASGKQAVCLAPSATGEDQVVLATLSDKGASLVPVTQEGAEAVALSASSKNPSIYFIRDGQPWRCDLAGLKAKPLATSKVSAICLGLLPPLKGVCR